MSRRARVITALPDPDAVRYNLAPATEADDSDAATAVGAEALPPQRSLADTTVPESPLPDVGDDDATEDELQARLALVQARLSDAVEAVGYRNAVGPHEDSYIESGDALYDIWRRRVVERVDKRLATEETLREIEQRATEHIEVERAVRQQLQRIVSFDMWDELDRRTLQRAADAEAALEAITKAEAERREQRRVAAEQERAQRDAARREVFFDSRDPAVTAMRRATVERIRETDVRIASAEEEELRLLEERVGAMMQPAHAAIAPAAPAASSSPSPPADAGVPAPSHTRSVESGVPGADVAGVSPAQLPMYEAPCDPEYDVDGDVVPQHDDQRVLRRRIVDACVTSAVTLLDPNVERASHVAKPPPRPPVPTMPSSPTPQARSTPDRLYVSQATRSVAQHETSPVVPHRPTDAPAVEPRTTEQRIAALRASKAAEENPHHRGDFITAVDLD